MLKLYTTKSVSLLILIAAYAPGVFRTSLWSDDYGGLIETSGFAEHILRDGRPTGAGIIFLSFTALGSASQAWILRFFALSALLVIYLMVDRSIKNSANYKVATLSIAIGLCLPSFQMYIHWIGTWHFLWTALAGLVAFLLWSHKRIIPKIIGVFLLALALTSYPPTALFYFAVIGVTGAINSRSSKRILEESIRGLTLLASAGLVAFISAASVLKSYGLTPNPRVNLVDISEIPNKVVWVISRPIVVGLRPFTIDSPMPLFAALTTIPVLAMLFFGVKRQSLELSENFIIRTSVIFLPLVFTLAPIMVTSDNQIEFRLLAGYCWGVVSLSSFFLFASLKDWTHRRNTNLHLARIAQVTTASILILVAVFTVNIHYEQFFGEPYRTKTSFLNEKISDCIDKNNLDKILILPPEQPFHSFSRLGVFSMSSDLASSWVPKANVELVLEQQNIKVGVEYLDPRPINFLPTDRACVIDLEEFRLLLNQKLGVTN